LIVEGDAVLEVGAGIGNKPPGRRLPVWGPGSIRAEIYSSVLYARQPQVAEVPEASAHSLFESLAAVFHARSTPALDPHFVA